MTRHNFALIGYAYGAAANTPGGNQAPHVMRALSVTDRLLALGHDVEDLGDAKDDVTEELRTWLAGNMSENERRANNFASTFSACRALAEKTTTALEHGRIPLILGGDHSLSIGSITAVSNFYRRTGREIGVLWVDTHADINTPETSPSHNIFGMSAAFLLGMIPGAFQSLQRPAPALRPENLVYVGLRDLDPGEKIHIRDRQITAYTTKEVDIYGMADVVRRALRQLKQNTAGYVVTFDLDVCDPALVPGTGTKVRGGLTYREAHLLLELVADEGGLLSFEMVELNPTLDQDFTTAELAVSLCESVAGKQIL